MATLTETAFYTRAIIKYGTIFIIFLIVGRVLWVLGSGVYKSIFPPPPPPPTVAFGKLPQLPFPEKSVPALSLSLQTPTGEIPNLPSQGLVYFMPESTSSLLALDESMSIAANLGFNGSRTALSEAIYRVEKTDTPATMDINIVNKTFSLNYDLTQAPDLLTTRPRSTSEAFQAVRFFLGRAAIFYPDLEEGTSTFEFLKVQDGQLQGAISLSEAQFVKVNLFRKKIKGFLSESANVDTELQVLTSDKKNANIWFIVTGESSQDKQIIAGEFHYFPVDETRTSTYPLKSAQQAWTELGAGKGYIAQLPTGGETQVTVRNVYLAYYDSGRPQEFLQPIVVFEGDSGFIAYVPAISLEYYSDPDATSFETPAAQ